MESTVPSAQRRGPRFIGRPLGVAVAVVAVLALLLASGQGTIQSALLGAGSGALIGALALGVVVVYRGSGVINVASGAMAMYAAYVFNSLNAKGELLIVAWRVDLGDPWPFVPSMLGAMVVAALMSAVYYFAVFGPLRSASPVSKLVASVGLLLTIQAIVVLAYGARPIPVKATFPKTPIRLPGGLFISTAQLTLVIAVVLVGTALWAVYRFSLFGLLTRASAEDGRHLMLIGRSPLVVGVGNWLFAGVVIALMSVLSTPIAGTVNPTTSTLLVVPALAAAVLGRFVSFAWAVGGGLAIGMLQAMAQYWTAQPWFPQADNLPLPGLAESVPLIVIVVALLVQRRSVTGRGSLDGAGLPFAPPSKHVMRKLAIGLVVGIAAFLVLDSAWRLATINTLVGIAICLSFVVLTGYVGQVSLAQMSLAGASAFILANFATKFGIGFPLGPILGALGAMVVGLLVGYAALRVRGVQLAIVTLAFAVAITAVVFQNAAWSRQGAGAEVPAPSIFGWEFGPGSAAPFGDSELPNPVFGMFVLVTVLLLCWMTYSIRDSAWGRRMLAVRINERAAAAAGVSVRNTKLIAFAASGFIAGIGGALSAYRFGVVTPEYFGVFASLSFLAFAYMGGISSVGGAVIGGFLVTNGLVFTALEQWLGLSPNFTLLVGGLGLVLTVVMNPDGIAGTAGAQIKGLLGRRGKAGGPPSNVVTADVVTGAAS
ncbi:ABC transporter permease [Longivirga aurantiaca]|uniref:ABC transporter permease n=1 Tax=Longivirga aurantiaca TaxID=1837743 RepID=A0ABW1SYS0_9ACTN